MKSYEVLNPADVLKRDRYLGRGIVVGTSPDGAAVTAYFISGRSENSRNRVFEMKEDGLYTKAFDESKVKDPSLIIYRAAAGVENCDVVTNGDQTDTIVRAVKGGGTFESALMTRDFEPDAPNFTPRISAMITYLDGSFTYKMSIIKSTDHRGTASERHFFNYPSVPGVGHFISTYDGDGDPLPPFRGEPVAVTIPRQPEELSRIMWDALDNENKISLYVSYNADGEDNVIIMNKNGECRDD